MANPAHSGLKLLSSLDPYRSKNFYLINFGVAATVLQYSVIVPFSTYANDFGMHTHDAR